MILKPIHTRGDHSMSKYIAIEGAIGVGKSALARRLGDRLNARVFMEGYEKNPFIADFYEDMKANALPTQLFFLLSRYQQLQTIRQTDILDEYIITDYLFEKDLIFSALTLNENELIIHRRLYDLLKNSIVKPDLVIFLQAETQTLMERIKARNRDFEKKMDAEYIEQLNREYNLFFFRFTAAPLLIVKTTGVDFINIDANIDILIDEIARIKSGRHYFEPPGAKYSPGRLYIR